MIALVRKELRLSLDVLRPVAIIAATALLVGPLVYQMTVPRFVTPSQSLSETFDVIGFAAVALMPLVGAALACALTVGDERHGARTLLALLPVRLGTHASLKFAVGAGLTAILSCILPWFAWSMASIAEALEISARAGPSTAVLSLIDGTLVALVLGAIGFAVGWGASGLGRPLIAALGYGVLGALTIAMASIGAASRLVDHRYDFHHDAVTIVGMVVLLVAIGALFVAGTMPRFGVSMRWRVIAIVVLAVIVASSGPVVMYREFARPAWEAGLIEYTEAELAARDIWSFGDHLHVPEPGYGRGAALLAIQHKLRMLTMTERREFFERAVDEIVAQHEDTARQRFLWRTLWIGNDSVPHDLILRLANSLDDRAPRTRAESLLNLLQNLLDPPPAAIAPIERYWELHDPRMRSALEPSLERLRMRAAAVNEFRDRDP